MSGLILTYAETQKKIIQPVLSIKALLNGVQHGVPAGGLTGQSLAKVSSADYDMEWISLGAGSAIWGSITGTLANQSDLVNYINSRGFITSVPAQSFSSLTGKPTTLSGYGIVDAYPLSGNPSGFISSVPAQSFSSLTGKPTTISGYGITDTLSQLLTGYASGAGTVSATDSILGAIQKLNGNDGLRVLATRTITTTSPLLIGGGASADLSADRTLSWDFSIANTWTGAQTLSSNSNTFLHIKSSVATGTSCAIYFDAVDSTNQVYYGRANAAGQLVIGSVAGDAGIRSATNINLSANNGTAIQLQLASAGGLTYNYPSLGTTIAGFSLINATAAAVGAQQNSPSITFQGSAWKTAATASAAPVYIRNYLQAIQATSQGDAELIWDYSTIASTPAVLMGLRADSVNGFATLNLGYRGTGAPALHGVIQLWRNAGSVVLTMMVNGAQTLISSVSSTGMQITCGTGTGLDMYGVAGSRFSIAASTTTRSQFNFVTGVDKTTSVDGDFWYNGTNLILSVSATKQQILANAGLTSSIDNVVTNKIKVNIGGTAYYLHATTSAT